MHRVLVAGAALMIGTSCQERPVPAPPAAPVVEPSAPSAPPADLGERRALLEVVLADDGTDPSAEIHAAVPLLCHDGNGWSADPRACLTALRDARTFIAEDGRWSSAGKLVAVHDRDYRGVVLAPGAKPGLAFAGVEAWPEPRCRHHEAPPPRLTDEVLAQLSPKIPKAFATGYPGNASTTAFVGDFDGDGTDDELHSIVVEEDAGRLDLVVLKRARETLLLGHEWAIGDTFGGAPEQRLVDIRGLTCFELDERAGLELVASLHGETERVHVAASFDSRGSLTMGGSVFFGD